jgi:hypothetical protein
VNSTIFSVVDTVAIRPLPFKDPEQLVGAAPRRGRFIESVSDARDRTAARQAHPS